MPNSDSRLIRVELQHLYPAARWDLLQKTRGSECRTRQEGNDSPAPGKIPHGDLGLGQAELLYSVANLIAIDPEKVCGLGLISAGPLERLEEELTFDLLE